MSEDRPTAKHERQISIWTGVYAFLISIIIFQTWDNNSIFLDLIEKLTGITPNFVKELISYGALVGVAIAIGRFLVTVRLHNYLDNLFLKTRTNVDNYIVRELSNVFNSEFHNPPRNLTHNDFMNIFYHFVGQDDDTINRNRAFSYWAGYYICVNLIALSIIGYGIFYLLIIFGNEIEPYIALTVILLFIIMGSFSFVALLSLQPKLQEKIAQPQVERITMINRTDLIAHFNSLMP